MSELLCDAVDPAASTAPVVSLAWDQICTPGTYVCNWSGHLLRVPIESVPAAGTSGFNIVGTDPLFVTKISDDPELNLARARETATELNLTVGF